jgi:hypothetical protein
VFEWFIHNEALVWWVLVLSFISLLLTSIAVPVILIRLPEDYFSFPSRHRVQWLSQNRLLRIPLIVIKNLLGAIFLLAGTLMLVLPGQGILTIIIGLILMEFPGKYRVERWVINRPSVLRVINWIRAKAGKQKLVMQLNDESDHGA